MALRAAVFDLSVSSHAAERPDGAMIMAGECWVRGYLCLSADEDKCTE